MQGTFNSGTVIATEGANTLGDEREILAIDLPIGEGKLGTLKSRFRHPAEIHDNLDEIVIAFSAPSLGNGFRNSRWKHRKQDIEIALSNAFGFGGTNATLAFRKYRG